ncbi:cyclase family protein [Ottowia thiooxydans]|uniref:cyclase family protein n=1 Tax=Ottowia thiooxydans TaxID=219182 RepID=UPI00041C7E14|nr:cyclase family protein [Ottowia thiooxydans]
MSHEAGSAIRWRTRPEGSNWGDFGVNDEVGRLNLLTASARLEGIAEARTGKAFNLSLPLDFPGGNVLHKQRHAPLFSFAERGDSFNYNYRLSAACACFTDVVCDEAVTLYTQYSTQWDGLAHYGSMFDVEGNGQPVPVYYNGFRAGLDIVGPSERQDDLGAARLGIENMSRTGVQGRAVLVDLHSIYGEERILVGYDRLMRALDDQKISFGSADFLCIYTGFSDLLLRMNRKPDALQLENACAALDGRDQRLLHWISDSSLVAICADNLAVEAYPAAPSFTKKYPALPLHEHCLFKLGMHLGELWYFKDLADALRRESRSSFLLTAPPLHLPRAAGSPATPIATI